MPGSSQVPGVSPGRLDVYVDGARDSSPAGRQALAARLSQKFGVPLPALTQRLQGGRFRCFSGLGADDAQRMVGELAALGALASAAPAAPAPAPPPSTAARAPGPPPAAVPRPAPPAAASMPDAVPEDALTTLDSLAPVPRPAAGVPFGGSADADLSLVSLDETGPRATPRPGGTPGLGAFAPPGEPAGLSLGSLDERAGAPRVAAAPSHPAARPAPTVHGSSPAAAAADDPFAPPDMVNPVELELAAKPGLKPARSATVPPGGRPAAPPPASPASSGRFTAVDAGPALQLDTSGSMRKAQQPADPNAYFGGDSTLEASSSLSMPRMPAADAEPDMARCKLHGLLYDSKREGGCRRCRLATAAREVAARRWLFLGGRLREKPGQRALVGLLFAMAIGFLPAAWYMHHLHGGRLLVLEQQQNELAQDPRLSLPGSEVRAQLTEVSSTLDSEQSQGLIAALVLWLAVGGAAGAVFYKYT